MTHRVLDVGQCGPDHSAIRALFESLGAQVDRVALTAEALQQARRAQYSLVLVNRKLDEDYSDGTELIRLMKADPQLSSVPVMLISNYADAQAEAVRLGAAHGFGKASLSSAQTRDRLREYFKTPV